MKFYIPTGCIYLISEDDCFWLQPVEFISYRNAIKLNKWANGWLAEADESFNSYFTIISGSQLPIITDAEYFQVVADGIAFFSKERAKQFRSTWREFELKINS